MKHVLAICLLAVTVSAATITVDLNGTGDHTTIAAGVAAAGAGDTVLVKDGDYGERFTVNVSGSAGSPVVIRSENRYGAVLVGMYLVGDYISIERFEFSGPNAFGVSGLEPAHIRVTDNRFISIANDYAVTVGEYGYVARNMMTDVISGVHLRSHSLAEDNRIIGLTDTLKSKFFFFKGDSITLRGNYMWTDDARRYKKCHFFTTWDDYDRIPSRDILIEGNIGFNSKHGSEPTSLVTHLSERLTYRNNLFVNTDYVGICTKYISEVKIYNNTFVNCGAYPIWLQSTPHPGHVVKNNIFAYIDAPAWLEAKKHLAIRTDGELIDADNNLFYNIRPWSGGLGDNSLADTDPLFVNPTPYDTATCDFSLKPNSPAIDAGCDVDFSTDLRGGIRPAGAVDMGAYEYGAVTPVREDAARTHGTELQTGIHVNPVPALSGMTVTGSVALGTVAVLDMAGQVVWQGYTDGIRLSIDTSGLQAGQYLVRTCDGVRVFVVAR